MLLTIKAVTRTIAEDSRRTGKKYHLNAHMVASIHGSSAVAPAGGCVVLVRCMTMSAIAVARLAASHWSRGSGSSWRLNWKIVAMMTPTRPLKKCPKMSERGCARGTSMAP
jgi:hypothetical protein